MVVASRTKGEPRPARYYPAYDVKPKVKGSPGKPQKLRESLQPGTIVIILAGRFRGKRAVMLKALESGLLLVTGPFSVNGVPLRRVNAAYVIATSTRLDVASVEVPATIDDSYFAYEKPAKKPKTKKDDEGDFFSPDEPDDAATGPSETRLADQKTVDDQLLPIVEAHDPLLKAYLGALFSLKKGQKPHEMKW
mmetsp:Transcript_18541/g.74022  ORF Transcript_18541/g.74022 Transcript_18541/m.74022 type:complete len:193 (-) Transcript_18541:1391-1969(-)